MKSIFFIQSGVIYVKVPLFNENVEIETFNTTEDDEEDARVAAATDMAFQIIRNGKECHKHD
jgi:hypothetical protein